jgi:hypothetical protein
MTDGALRLAWPGGPGGGARRHAIGELARYLGALAVLAVGIDHLVEFAADYYSAIPTIGTLFALNFASSLVIAGGLLAPVRRLGGRLGDLILAVFAVGGIALAAGSLAGLLVSESVGLFGFMEQGYRAAIVLAIALEVAAIGLLGAFLALNPMRLALPRR